MYGWASVAELQQIRLAGNAEFTTPPLFESIVRLDDVIVAGGISYHRPSLAHRVFVAPVNRFIVWPIRNLSRDIRDWKADRRETREERRAERLAKKVARPEETIASPAPEITPELVQSQKLVNPRRLSATPNPFTDHLRVSFELSVPQEYTLELLSSAGKTITTLTRVGLTGYQQVELNDDIANLPSGTYFLRLTTKEGDFSVVTLVR